MDGELRDGIPCSSLAVDSFLRLGAAGSAWGMFFGPYEAQKRGLTGLARTAVVASCVGKYGIQCGLFAGVLSATNCGIQRYRMKKDWVNASVAGAITGALLAAKTKSWMQIFSTAAVVSGIAAAADHWRKI
ncbi:outer envelope pore protein 16-4, chloroplastic [Nymphaea colorata]|nr:outer envelope pore protein 16-4, chloroplastic [Nymphaea colorata]